MIIKFKTVINHFPFFNKTKLYNKEFLTKNNIKAILLKQMIVIIKELMFSQKKYITDKNIRFFI